MKRHDVSALADLRSFESLKWIRSCEAQAVPLVSTGTDCDVSRITSVFDNNHITSEVDLPTQSILYTNRHYTRDPEERS
jgi:hypothetical protein